MLKIRLQRVGRVHIPTFRVVLTDSRNAAKSGKFIEILGTYDPVNNVKEVKEDRVKHWISNGAQVSDTVHNMLVDKKVIPGKKINALPKKKPIIKEGEAKAEATPAPAATAAAPVAEAAPEPASAPEAESAPESAPEAPAPEAPAESAPEAEPASPEAPVSEEPKA